MRKRRKAAVVGVYGIGADFTTGQAVKCYEVINWLKENYGRDEIQVVNTYKWKKNPIKLFAELVKAFARCENIIIMPAPNGIKVFGPLSYYLKKVFPRRVHYIVIGGWLAEVLARKKHLKKCVASFDGVYAETHEMVEKLERLSLKNAVYMPNCRKLPEMKPVKPETWTTPVRVCTYSRVVKEKGIEDAADIVRNANRMMGNGVFFLDVYGKVADEFKTEFEELLKRNNDIMKYCGVKKADEGIKILTPYFSLLFPTYYEGEGVAGTVLDAFAAETPVIANEWKYIREIITDKVNGFIYPFRDNMAAAEILCNLYRSRELEKAVQKGCRISKKNYSTEKVLAEFAEQAFKK